jgi:hypothetical protein
MLARVTLFDQRVRTLARFRDVLPQLRLVQPTVATGPPRRLRQSCRQDQHLLPAFKFADQDIDDRRDPTPRAASASSTATFILTATLSSRLGVDNGIKIWYLLGQLLHVQDCEELYQASWSDPLRRRSPFSRNHPAPSPSPSVQDATATAKPSPRAPDRRI